MTSMEVNKCVTQWIKDRENQILTLSLRLAEEIKAFEKASNAHSDAMYKNESSDAIALFEKRFDDAFCKFRDTDDEIVNNKVRPKWKELLEADYSYNEYFKNVFRGDGCHGLVILLDRMNYFIGIYSKYEDARKNKDFSPRKTENFENHLENVENYLKTLAIFGLDKDELGGWTEQALYALELEEHIQSKISKFKNESFSSRFFLHTDNFNAEKIDVPTRTDIIQAALNDIFVNLKKNNIDVHTKNLEKVIRRFFEIY